MKNKVLKITAALLFLLPHAGLDNNRFPVMLFLFYICSFVFFRNDMERNGKKIGAETAALVLLSPALS